MADLCSVADVRQFIQKPAADQNQDMILGWLITLASAEVERHAQREFTPSTAQTRVFVWRDGSLLDLAPYDIRTVTSVTLDPDIAPGTVVPAANYRLRPKPNRDGVYQWIEFRQDFLSDVEREVSIVGDWGFAAVPAEAKLATVVTTADWFRDKVAAFGTTFNEVTSRFEVPELLPAGAMSALSKIRRLTV